MPCRMLAVGMVLVGLLAACTPKREEPAGAAPDQSVRVNGPLPVRTPPFAGALNKPLADVTAQDLHRALKSLGWTPGSATETESDSVTTRIITVKKGSRVGTVTWYRTNDMHFIREAHVKGWPSAEDGNIILAVRLGDEKQRSDEGHKSDALVLLDGLVRKL